LLINGSGKARNQVCDIPFYPHCLLATYIRDAHANGTHLHAGRDEQGMNEERKE